MIRTLFFFWEGSQMNNNKFKILVSRFIIMIGDSTFYAKSDIIKNPADQGEFTGIYIIYKDYGTGIFKNNFDQIRITLNTDSHRSRRLDFLNNCN